MADTAKIVEYEFSCPSCNLIYKRKCASVSLPPHIDLCDDCLAELDKDDYSTPVGYSLPPVETQRDWAKENKKLLRKLEGGK